MKTVLVILAAVSMLSACTAVPIASSMRTPAESNYQSRCEQVDMRDTAAMAKIFEKYDGWRVFYISEFTTKHMFGASGVVCFERPAK